MASSSQCHNAATVDCTLCTLSLSLSLSLSLPLYNFFFVPGAKSTMGSFEQTVQARALLSLFQF
jgi:hypothetical protein